MSQITDSVIATEVSEHATRFGELQVKSVDFHPGKVVKGSDPTPRRKLYALGGKTPRLFFGLANLMQAAKEVGRVGDEGASAAGTPAESSKKRQLGDNNKGRSHNKGKTAGGAHAAAPRAGKKARSNSEVKVEGEGEHKKPRGVKEGLGESLSSANK